MKLSSRLSASLFGIGLSLLLFTCKKDNIDSSLGSSSPASNLAPIANAGADIEFNGTLCSPGKIVLDGSNSFDPEHHTLLYEWRKISGPSCTVSDSNSIHAYVTILQPGQYAFGLKVRDNGGLLSKDTVVINVTLAAHPVETDLDVNSSVDYSFSVDKPLTQDAALIHAAICHAFGIDPCPPYVPKARTSFATNFDVATIGQFKLNVDEVADPSLASNNHETSITISANNGAFWVWGACSVNFRQLIGQGGGSFNGTCQISQGSAMGCDQNIFSSLLPLSVSGTLDTTSHTVSLSLKGKVYF
jgi:hypothetical protein